MAGTPDPNVNLLFGNGNQQTIPDLATDVLLTIGAASGGPINKPRRVSDLAGVLTFLNGPLTARGSHHVAYSEACYLQRCGASVAGAVLSGPTKIPIGNSLATLALSNSDAVLHSASAGGAVLALTSGWALPPAPLPLTVAADVNVVACNLTVNYVDQDGANKTEVLAFAGGAQSVSTTGSIKQVISVTSNIDPVGTFTFKVTYPGPQEAFYGMLRITRGGQISGGYVQPMYSWSMDNGKNFSSPSALPSTGIVDLATYANGLIPQLLGMRATFTSGSTALRGHGSLKVAGADANGDVIFTSLLPGISLVITKLGGVGVLSVTSVAGSTVTIQLQTDGGGNILTTGAALVNFLNTDVGANTVTARTMVRARSCGTGVSLAGTLVSTAFVNGSIDFTARQEKVAYKVVEGSASTARSVVVTPNGAVLSGISYTLVTINLDVDANGERTSTANQIESLVNSDALASQYLSAAHAGTGAGLAGDTTGPVILPIALSAGDSWTFTTSAPKPSAGDLQASLTALLKMDDILSNITAIVLEKDGADDSDFRAIHTALDQLQVNYKHIKFGVISAASRGSLDEQLWVNNTLAAYPTRGTKVSLCAGDADTVIPAYGAELRRNISTLYCARLMTVPISENPGHVKCETNSGIKYGLDGVGSHYADPTNPTRLVSLYESTDALLQLHAANMVTLKTYPRLPGLFVRQGVQYVNDGDDWTFITTRRVGDVIADLAYLTALAFINEELLTDPTTGYLAESEHQRLENTVDNALRAELFGGVRQHATALKVTSTRTINFAQTFTVELRVDFVPRFPAITISIPINAVRTITS